MLTLPLVPDTQLNAFLSGFSAAFSYRGAPMLMAIAREG
jgi:hypothetical protein